MRADHPPAHVLGVAEAAERCCLQLGRARGARRLEAPAVFAQAALDVAPREAEIAAQIVDLARLGAEALGGRCHLGVLQVGERPVQIVGHALDRGEADPGPAALGVARRRGQGAPRRPPAAGITPRSCRMSPSKQVKREPVGGSAASVRPRSTSRSAAS